MDSRPSSPLPAGGAFLIQELSSGHVFTPGHFSEEQQQILQLCRDFVAQEIHPLLDRIDAQEPGLMPLLLDKAGKLGLLGAGIPEEYGGMGLDVVTNMLIQEGLGHSHAFATAFMGQTGIGTYPILYFGTEAQKARYLPGLASGAIKACYNLTEPGAGSDAMAGKTRADLTPDGKNYRINGQKIWISNSGFADLFVVFAKVDGDKMTCFLVPGDTPGLTLGEEEKKMGIKGSSTRQVFYEDVLVPAENIVGEIGRGHKIAFNALNMGRIKMAASSLGAARHAMELSIRYAEEREQFGAKIASFGAIQYKLAEMATRCYVLESAVYRTAYDIQAKESELRAEGLSENEALLGAAEEYAAECALLKLYGSEVLGYCVDEAVQIHGGNGFSADYPVERCYRDARIVRIYEGTSEINRILAVNMILKRGLAGRFAFSEALEAARLGEETEEENGGRHAVARLKSATLLAITAALDTSATGQQMVSMNLSDMVLEAFLAESALLRAERTLEEQGKDAARIPLIMSRIFLHDAADRVYKWGKDSLCACLEGEALDRSLTRLRTLTDFPPVNAIKLREMI